MDKKLTVVSVIQQSVKCLTKFVCQFSWTPAATILTGEPLASIPGHSFKHVLKSVASKTVHICMKTSGTSSIPHWLTFILHDKFRCSSGPFYGPIFAHILTWMALQAELKSPSSGGSVQALTRRSLLLPCSLGVPETVLDPSRSNTCFLCPSSLVLFRVGPIKRHSILRIRCF